MKERLYNNNQKSDVERRLERAAWAELIENSHPKVFLTIKFRLSAPTSSAIESDKDLSPFFGR